MNLKLFDKSVAAMRRYYKLPLPNKQPARALEIVKRETWRAGWMIGYRAGQRAGRKSLENE